MAHNEPQEETPIVRDKRRIDPLTGAVRGPADLNWGRPGSPGPGPDMKAAGTPTGTDTAPADERIAALEATVAERTSDLQRLQAEFTNYRRRVERDREVVRERAVANLLVGLLPVLDDIGRARSHGELEGGFKAVADSLEATVGKLGLQPFGEAGEPFDPTVHEALVHTLSSEVDGPTVTEVYQPGYKLGEQIIRPARVLVADAEEPTAETVSERATDTTDSEVIDIDDVDVPREQA
jgi:molecular chaperone GrpE